MMRIDCHAHVFTRAQSLIAERAYEPAHEAPLEAYLELLDAHGIQGGVLVQPSILGTDNGYMVDCLARADGRLRGVALVAPDAGEGELRWLAARRVAGVRINLLTDAARSDWSKGSWRALIRRLPVHDLLLQVQVPGRFLPQVLSAIEGWPGRLLLDHFGLPATEGPATILAAADMPNVCAKLSAPYRLQIADIEGHARALLGHFGADRLVWGSDWPWTRFEGAGLSYGDLLAQLSAWIPDPATREHILGAVPRALFGFDMRSEMAV